MAILQAAPDGRRLRGPSCRNAIMLAPPSIAADGHRQVRFLNSGPRHIEHAAPNAIN
jgi:hypothetical protein